MLEPSPSPSQHHDDATGPGPVATSTLTKRLRSAVRSRRRKVALRARRAAVSAGVRAKASAKAMPMPEPIRVRAHEIIPWRPGLRTVPNDRLLLGLQNRTPADEFARFIGDIRWPSTPVADGPHAALLRQAAVGDLTDADILDSDYAKFARQCIALRGFYFSATDDAGIVVVARDYLDAHRGHPPLLPGAHQSAPDSPPRVAPIAGSDCYQVLDGHHRIASNVVHGGISTTVRVKWLPVKTPLLAMLEEMTWTAGERQLYQPVQAPELEKGWTSVRRCTDRLEKMVTFLGERDMLPPHASSYVDVASCYGWFPSEMLRAGFSVAGIERDGLGPSIAEAAYGLDPSLIKVGDAVETLRASKAGWDVVSCFSLLHHFVLGRASTGPEDLLAALDGAARRVLFLDTGQANEEWFCRTLPLWTPTFIAEHLRSSTTFDEVIDLGPDEDAIPPYERNYRRHLFACVRN